MRMESTCCGVRKVMAVVVIGLGLVGCESGPEMYRGKVIAGASSLVMHADAGDSRLKEKGVEGAKVELRLKDRAGEKIVGTAISDVNGDFTLPPVAPRAVTQQLKLSASKEGMLPARADVYAPGVDRVLLVILKSVTGEAEGASAPVDKGGNKPQGR